MTTQINRYNPDGTENLDYWFGVRETRNNNSAYTMTINTPRYVRYTMENLKKRSTERLNKMFNNLFGYTTDRYSMIEKLFVELNNQWNTYEEKLATLVVSYQNMTKGKGTRGRKPKFEDTQVYNMVADYVVRGMKLTEIAVKYQTNIATISQTVNGKGTYAWLMNDNGMENEEQFYC